MIEVVIKDYLSERLMLPVLFEQGQNLPNQYVVIEKTGGKQQNKLLSAVFVFQSYADSLYESALLNERVKEIVHDLVNLDQISGVHLNSDYNFTDLDLKKYRYQAVFDINYY